LQAIYYGNYLDLKSKENIEKESKAKKSKKSTKTESKKEEKEEKPISLKENKKKPSKK
jgi:hypothetical protein